MTNLKDLIFRYCVLFGKRFWPKEKIAFLRVLTKEMALNGYKTDVKVAKLKLTKRHHRNYYNAYIGELESADIILCTYYNTGTKTFNLFPQKAFKKNVSHSKLIFNLLPSLLLFTLGLLLNLFFFIPLIKEVGIFSYVGFVNLIFTLVLFFYIIRFKNGIPNKKNFCCNSSTIILFIHLISLLEKKHKKKISFVLIDNELNSDFGLRMFESYSKKIKEKKIFFLDSITNGDTIKIFKPDHSRCTTTADLPTFEFNTSFTNTLFISSGEIVDNEIKIKNANTRKDNAISTKRLEQITNYILKICLSELKKESS